MMIDEIQRETMRNLAKDVFDLAVREALTDLGSYPSDRNAPTDEHIEEARRFLFSDNAEFLAEAVGSDIHGIRRFMIREGKIPATTTN